MKGTGTESVRKIGDLWVVGEWDGMMPGCDVNMKSIITLGYDPMKNRFVGSFIASVMTHMWLYDGSLDSATRTLTLDTVGPSFDDPNVMAKYQDVVRFIDDDHRTLTSRLQNNDGSWMEFMKMTVTRTK